MWFIAPILKYLGVIGTGAALKLTAFLGLATALRYLFKFSLALAIPLILYNVILSVFEGFAQFAFDHLSNIPELQGGLVIEFTGLGAWVANVIMLPQAFSTFLTFLAIRAGLNLITFRL